MRKFITFVLLLIAISALFPLYTRYKVIAAPIPLTFFVSLVTRGELNKFFICSLTSTVTMEP